jgi:hypothetical protein
MQVPLGLLVREQILGRDHILCLFTISSEMFEGVLQVLQILTLLTLLWVQAPVCLHALFFSAPSRSKTCSLGSRVMGLGFLNVLGFAVI